MLFTLLILDGILLLTFLVGWVEATALPSYRWSWWRFLRAASLPFVLGALFHLVVTQGWWVVLFAPVAFLVVFLIEHGMKWLVPALSAMIGGAILLLGVPLGVLRLVDFVATQFDDEKWRDLSALDKAKDEP